MAPLSGQGAQADVSPRAAPVEARQRLLLRTHFAAAGSGALASLVLFLCAAFGVLPTRVAAEGSLIIAVLIAVVYALIRSGLNRRFADPTMTTPRIGAALLFLAYVMYHAEQARNAMSLFYLVAMLFGVLRLGTRPLLALAMLALAAHAAMLYLWHLNNPAAELTPSLVHLAALGIVLPWFALMGGYVSGLRRRLSDTNHELRQAVDRIEQIAIRDALTGVHNRRFLADMLLRECARAERLQSTLSVGLFDIDHFKSINDSFGHGAGDAVLKHFAAIASTGLRATDLFGRYGGEEFLLILPDTDARGAAAAAHRIRSNIEAAAFPQIPAERRVTVTVGVACRGAGENAEALLQRADAGLYRGKEAGRNRVILMG